MEGKRGKRSVVRLRVYLKKCGVCVPGIFNTSLAHSTTASWNPRQIPRKGTFCSRAYLMASIIPSVPRCPKPPGTRMPLGGGYRLSVC